jgi:arsenate reductase
MTAEPMILLEKPSCTTCRKVSKYLRDRKIDFQAVDYFRRPLSRARLKEIVRTLDAPAEDLIRRGDAAFKKLGLEKQDMSEEKIIGLLAAHPELLQRPVLIRGGRAYLVRPAEKIQELTKRA